MSKFSFDKCPVVVVGTAQQTNKILYKHLRDGTSPLLRKLSMFQKEHCANQSPPDKMSAMLVAKCRFQNRGHHVWLIIAVKEKTVSHAYVVTTFTSVSFHTDPVIVSGQDLRKIWRDNFDVLWERYVGISGYRDTIDKERILEWIESYSENPSKGFLSSGLCMELNEPGVDVTKADSVVDAILSDEDAPLLGTEKLQNNVLPSATAIRDTSSGMVHMVLKWPSESANDTIIDISEHSEKVFREKLVSPEGDSITRLRAPLVTDFKGMISSDYVRVVELIGAPLPNPYRSASIKDRPAVFLFMKINKKNIVLNQALVILYHEMGVLTLVRLLAKKEEFKTILQDYYFHILRGEDLGAEFLKKYSKEAFSYVAQVFAKFVKITRKEAPKFKCDCGMMFGQSLVGVKCLACGTPVLDRSVDPNGQLLTSDAAPTAAVMEEDSTAPVTVEESAELTVEEPSTPAVAGQPATVETESVITSADLPVTTGSASGVASTIIPTKYSCACGASTGYDLAGTRCRTCDSVVAPINKCDKVDGCDKVATIRTAKVIETPSVETSSTTHRKYSTRNDTFNQLLDPKAIANKIKLPDLKDKLAAKSEVGTYVPNGEAAPVFSDSVATSLSKPGISMTVGNGFDRLDELPAELEHIRETVTVDTLDTGGLKYVAGAAEMIKKYDSQLPVICLDLLLAEITSETEKEDTVNKPAFTASTATSDQLKDMWEPSVIKDAALEVSDRLVLTANRSDRNSINLFAISKPETEKFISGLVWLGRDDATLTDYYLIYNTTKVDGSGMEVAFFGANRKKGFFKITCVNKDNRELRDSFMTTIRSLSQETMDRVYTPEQQIAINCWIK